MLSYAVKTKKKKKKKQGTNFLKIEKFVCIFFLVMVIFTLPSQTRQTPSIILYWYAFDTDFGMTAVLISFFKKKNFVSTQKREQKQTGDLQPPFHLFFFIGTFFFWSSFFALFCNAHNVQHTQLATHPTCNAHNVQKIQKRLNAPTHTNLLVTIPNQFRSFNDKITIKTFFHFFFLKL